MSTLSKLQKGDCVEIIAPASRCSDAQLLNLQALLESWGLQCIVNNAIFGDDLLCANTDEARFQHLYSALENPATKAIICARGGYGSMRLIPNLSHCPSPTSPKLFVGMSDITALHLFLNQTWHWPTIHGSLSTHIVSDESIAAMKSLLFGDVETLNWVAQPLNTLAQQAGLIESTLIGGNLCLLQASIGTNWQLNAADKIVFMEDIGERGYRIDRMLEHLTQSQIVQHAAAIIFGDFIEGQEPDGSSLVQPVLEKFAQHSPIPVLQITGVGHGGTNFPILFGTPAQLHLGHVPQLICNR